MVHIWVINEHASSHSRLKSYVQKGLQLPALLYITEDADKRGLQVQQLEHSALSQSVQDALVASPLVPLSASAAPPLAETEPSPSGAEAARSLSGNTLMAGSGSGADVPQPAAQIHDKALLAPAAKMPSAALHEALSARELQTLMLLGQGLSVSGIARNLALSVKTISTYRARTLEKLHLNTTADLIRYAVEHLLLPIHGETTHHSIS